MKTHYLFPGQFVVYREPCLITTILGSCVAIALFDPLKKIAGLNHYLLPQPGSANGLASLRYGSVSFEQMIESMASQGAGIERLQAKIFGGAKVLDNLNLGESIGKQNVDFALKVLAEKKIKVISSEVGGSVGRKIILNSFDFSVTHQLMNEHSRSDSSSGHSPYSKRTVRVVVVDDSSAVRSIFARVLSQSGRVEVVGVARDAFQAREVIVDLKPDVILLDIEMPGMSGVQFLEKLMQHFPIPTIMVSSLNPDDDAAVRALELGALEFVHKPHQYDPNALRFFAENLVQKVIAAANSAEKVKMLGRSPRAASSSVAAPVKSVQARVSDGLHLILVGGNGGAHSEVETLLKSLPNDSPPVLVSVSSVSDHLKAFIQKWSASTTLQLREASDGLVPLRGSVYFAPCRKHLTLENLAGQAVMRLREGPPVCLQMPSSELLFDSAAQVYNQSRLRGVVSILLSGFGADGVQGLLKLREHGSETIVIHPDSSVFSFTPQAAVDAGAADHVLPVEQMSSVLMKIRSQAAV